MHESRSDEQETQRAFVRRHLGSPPLESLSISRRLTLLASEVHAYRVWDCSTLRRIPGRGLGRLGSSRDGIDVAVVTGYDPLLSEEPALDRPIATSLKQRIAFGSGPDTKCDGLARALAMKGNAPKSQIYAVPVSSGFRCTPTPGSQRTGATS
jgi:hypothetical protein